MGKFGSAFPDESQLRPSRTDHMTLVHGGSLTEFCQDNSFRCRECDLYGLPSAAHGTFFPSHTKDLVMTFLFFYMETECV